MNYQLNIFNYSINLGRRIDEVSDAKLFEGRFLPFAPSFSYRFCSEMQRPQTFVSIRKIFCASLKKLISSIVKLQRKIYQANLALQYFVLNNWNFENKNFMNLSQELKVQDLKAFYFTDFLEFDLILYFRYATLGARRNLLNERDEDLPKARRHYRRMKLLDSFLKAFIYGSILFLVFVKYDFLSISSTLCKVVGSYKC